MPPGASAFVGLAALALQATAASAQVVWLDRVDGSVAVDFSHPVSGAQCGFRDGEKAVLLRLSARNYILLLTRRDVGAPDTVATIEILPNGDQNMEANGGVATYAAIGRVFDELRGMRRRRIEREDLASFRQTQRVPKCRRDGFADYYPW